jgi:hypothetical protein
MVAPVVISTLGPLDALNLTEEDRVVVVGEMDYFALADVDTTYGLDLDDELYVDYEGEPVLIAAVIQPIEAAPLAVE